MDLSLNLDSKKYERISWSFKEKKPLKFDFLLAWHPTGMGSKLYNDNSGFEIFLLARCKGGLSCYVSLWSRDTVYLGVWPCEGAALTFQVSAAP